MKAHERYIKAYAVIIWGAIINLLLAFIKIAAGIIGHSYALVADGIHSLSDLIIDALVYFAARYGSQLADEDHPYGHARIETAAAIGVAFVLLAFGSTIILNAISHLLGHQQRELPHLAVLIVAVFSIIIKEGIYQWSIRVARAQNSALLHTNAWHHRSDVLTSFIVLIAVLGAFIGFIALDSIAAIIIGVLVIKMGVTFVWDGLRELVDTGVNPKQVEKMQQIIKSVVGVKALHQLRTRSMAGKIFADVHVLVSPEISVSEGHYISDQVQHALIKNIDELQDVTVHIDIEEDVEDPESLAVLPSREKLLPQLNNYWQDLPLHNEIKKILLHYIDGKINIDIYFQVNVRDNLLDLSLGYLYFQAINHYKFIQKVRIYFEIA